MWHAFAGIPATVVAGAHQQAYDPATIPDAPQQPGQDRSLICEPLIDPARLPDVEAQRIASFARWIEREAPSGGPVAAVGWLAAIVSADEGPPLGEIGAAALESILLDRIPAIAVLGANAVGPLVDGLRVYYEWLARQGDPFAASCIAWLDDDAVNDLACNLADNRRWTSAKREIMLERP